MSRKHNVSLEALLVGLPKWYWTEAKNEDGSRVALPYYVIYPEDGVDEVTRLTGPGTTLHPSWTVHSVGETTDQAMWAAEAFKTRLVPNGRGVTPVVAGEYPGAFWWRSPIPVQIDRDVSPPLHFHVAECGFSSDLP